MLMFGNTVESQFWKMIITNHFDRLLLISDAVRRDDRYAVPSHSHRIIF